MATNRDAKLLKLEQEHREYRAKIQGDDRYSESYKARLLHEAHQNYMKERAAEEERVRKEMRSEAGRNYTYIHKRERGDSGAWAAEELREANIREELMVELNAGQSPIRLYEEAAKVGDDTRLRLLPIVGPGFIEDVGARIRFQDMVRGREPADVKRARQRLEDNERQTMVFDTASSIRKSLNDRRARRLASSAPASPESDLAG